MTQVIEVKRLRHFSLTLSFTLCWSLMKPKNSSIYCMLQVSWKSLRFTNTLVSKYTLVSMHTYAKYKTVYLPLLKRICVATIEDVIAMSPKAHTSRQSETIQLIYLAPFPLPSMTGAYQWECLLHVCLSDILKRLLVHYYECVWVICLLRRQQALAMNSVRSLRYHRLENGELEANAQTIVHFVVCSEWTSIHSSIHQSIYRCIYSYEYDSRFWS